MQYDSRDLTIEYYEGPYEGIDGKWAMRWSIFRKGAAEQGDPLATGEVTGLNSPDEASKEAMRRWSLQAVEFFSEDGVMPFSE